jgi:phosphoribosylanthranilate isomerase
MLQIINMCPIFALWVNKVVDEWTVVIKQIQSYMIQLHNLYDQSTSYTLEHNLINSQTYRTF